MGAPPTQTPVESPVVVLKLNSRSQVTLPARVLDALGLKPGDRIRLDERREGFFLVPHRVDLSRLAPLRHVIRRGAGTFDIHRFRNEPHDPHLRD